MIPVDITIKTSWLTQEDLTFFKTRMHQLNYTQAHSFREVVTYSHRTSMYEHTDSVITGKISDRLALALIVAKFINVSLRQDYDS